MTERLTTTGSAAFWSGLVGSLVGVTADSAVLSRRPSVGTFAFYFLVGWLAGLGYGGVRGRVTPVIGALIVAIGAFALYPLNVFWLEAEPFQSRKSIAADVLLLSAFALSVWLLRKWALRPAPAGRRFALTGLGVVTAACGLLFSGSAPPARDGKGNAPTSC